METTTPSQDTITPSTELLKMAFDRFITHWKTFIGVTFLSWIPAIFSGLIDSYNIVPFVGFMPDGGLNFRSKPLTYLSATLGLLSLFTIVWGTIAIIIFIKNQYVKTPVLVLFARAQKKFWDFFWTMILGNILVLIALFLLIIPGIFLSIIFSMARIIVISDNVSGWKALKKSSLLIRGHFWAVFGRFFSFGFFLILLNTPVIIAVITIDRALESTFASTVYIFLASLIFMPITTLYHYFIYEDLSKL